MKSYYFLFELNHIKSILLELYFDYIIIEIQIISNGFQQFYCSIKKLQQIDSDKMPNCV